VAKKEISNKKKCTECKHKFPATKKYFTQKKVKRKAGTVYRLMAKCKDCVRIKKRKYKPSANSKNKKAERAKKDVIEITDSYVAQMITRNSKVLVPSDVINNKEFIDLCRQQMKLNRAISEINKKQNKVNE